MTILDKHQQALKDAGMDSQGILRNVPTDCRRCNKPIEEAYLHASLHNGMCYRCQKGIYQVTVLLDGCIVWSVPGQHGKEFAFQYDGCTCDRGQVWKDSSYGSFSYKWQCDKCINQYKNHPIRMLIGELNYEEYILQNHYSDQFKEDLHFRMWQRAKKIKRIPKGVKLGTQRWEKHFLDLCLDGDFIDIRKRMIQEYQWCVELVKLCRQQMKEYVAQLEIQYPHLHVTEEERSMV